MNPDDLCLACEATAGRTGFCGAHAPVPFCPICGGDGRVAYPGDRGASACPCTTRGPQTLERRVAAWAALQGLTMSDVADLLGVAPSTLQRWLRGVISLRGPARGRSVGAVAPVTRLADLLGVEPGDLESPQPWRVQPGG